MVLLGDSANRLGAHQQEIHGSEVVFGAFEPLTTGGKLLDVKLDRVSSVGIIRSRCVQPSDLRMAETFESPRLVRISEMKKDYGEVRSDKLIGITHPNRLYCP